MPNDRANNPTTDSVAAPARPRRTSLRWDAADARSCSLETRRRILRQLPFFHDLPSAETTRIGGLFWERGFSPGEVIYHEGEPSAHLYVLAIGKVRLGRADGERRRVLLDMFGPGDFFGTLAALDGPTYPDTAVALTAGCALVITVDAFRDLIAQHPSIAIAALQAVSGRLEAARARIALSSSSPLDQRVAATLERLAARFGERQGSDLLIQIPLTRQDLAEMTGATIESVSRVVSRFQREGLVHGGRGWIAVRDPERLAAVSGSGTG